jgi:hypothetical protein
MHDPAKFVDVDQLESKQIKPGIFATKLRHDPVSQSSTSFIRISPADGYEDQPCAHFHHATEEIFILSGKLTFDSRTILRRGGYVYHPSEFVHGSKSKVFCESHFISRTSAPLDFNMIEQPLSSTPYFIGATYPDRDLSMISDAFDRPWVTRMGRHPDQIWRELVLSACALTDECTKLMEIESGVDLSTSLFGEAGQATEIFLVSGKISDRNGKDFSTHSYAHFALEPDMSYGRTQVPTLIYCITTHQAQAGRQTA